MKASWNIFLNDLKNIGTNWVAAILIGGLILLPSLYAWFNIEASWDPYGQTDQIPIGIVNEDKGAIVREEEIHVGDELVDSLKENQSMDWQFVDRELAMDKLEYGDYFAVIIIPENFSERLGTVVSGNPEKANVEYYVNEKINAIAPKITQKGATVIVEQISSNFISTVNGIIFEVFNDLGIELEENLPDIERFEEYIFTLEENLPEIYELLNETITDADRAGEIIDQAQGLIPQVEDATTSGLQTIDDTTDFLQTAEDRLNEMAPKIDEELANIQRMVMETNEFVSNIDSTTIDLTEGNPLSETLPEQIDTMLKSIDTIEEALIQLQQQNDKNNESTDEQTEEQDSSNNQETIDQALNELENMEQSLRELQEQLSAMESFLTDKQAEVDETFAMIKDRTAKANERVDEFVKEYKETIEPTVKEEVSKAKETLANARDILVTIQSTIPEIKNMLNRTDENLSEGKDILDYVSGEFPYVQDKVNELADRIRTVQDDTDLNELIQLLQNDPEAERGFFAEPVVLNENKLFPIPNYGTGMTPFYTVLAIWVGGLLLISLLSTDIHHKENYTGRQIYFGRLFTFISIGFLQTIIVTVGNIFLLQVDISHLFWFILFGLLCSAVFIMIVYTLVSVFGDVGKALAIILLVLQIAGSGGTYPVVLLPKFFQVINPFLPFTYAIDLMREAVGGIVWERVVHDVIFLMIFGLLALIVGGFLKETINKQTDKLKNKSKESGIFH
ncbi:YhgE/Pip domain-containing protein [Ornithinibacillus sp. L9]|uniref:YhgE/Pip domain-containing protein n=1 Tax=Ornithinibacillus caprae TaxID=2678566 RepID=A0A6N8FH04_9BACI|nr:YhgE/Pip domain-containing protein [Ornithinibacillus caprae]MUK88942.1 YhgE/Pip domain-containing protein [Ornithinibacillus caprae]